MHAKTFILIASDIINMNVIKIRLGTLIAEGLNPTCGVQEECKMRYHVLNFRKNIKKVIH